MRVRDRDTWLSFESERDDETARLSAWIESYTDSELFSTGGEGGRGDLSQAGISCGSAGSAICAVGQERLHPLGLWCAQLPVLSCCGNV